MKVYFDQQIWALLNDGRIDPQIIDKAAEMSECKYYLSVAHLEELHTSEKKETEEKKGITGKLEAFMKSHAVSGVIKETFEGIRFHTGEKEYNIARYTVWKIVEQLLIIWTFLSRLWILVNLRISTQNSKQKGNPVTC